MKFSKWALLCFLFGFSGLFLHTEPIWPMFSISVLAIGCGVTFKIGQKQLKKMGNTLYSMGIILGGVVLLLAFLFSSFKLYMSSEKRPDGLDVESQVSFFKNGNKLVFDAGIKGKKQIFSYNVESSKTEQLTFIGTNLSPAAFPLDDRMVFVSNRDGNSELYLMDADGSNQRRLTNNIGEDGAASFSLDGKKIVFQRITNRPRMRRIFVMDVGSAKEDEIFACPYALSYLDPIFIDDNTVRFETAGWVYLIDVPQRKEISKKNKIQPAYNPIYSSDRQKVVFQDLVESYRPGDKVVYEVVVANSDGSNRKQITHNEACNRPKVFSPDGEHIIFLSGKASDWGNLAMWQVDIDGKNPRKFEINL